MNLADLHEAKLASRKPQYNNLSDEKVVQMFFDEDEEQSRASIEEYDEDDELYGVRHFYVKSGLVIREDRRHEIISNVLMYPVKGKKKIAWTTQDYEAEYEWGVSPSKFEVDMTQPVYRK